MPKQGTPQHLINTYSFNKEANAIKQLPVLVIPESRTTVITNVATEVGINKLLRIKGDGSSFIEFNDDSAIITPSVSRDNSLELPSGFFYIISTGRYIFTNGASAINIEIIGDESPRT